MVCDKCGTEVTKNDKFCPKCGAGTRQPSKHMLKPILLSGLILLILILCIVLKYMAIIPISIILILGLAIVINRKILRLRKNKKNDVQVEEQKFSDKEMEKLSEYFVNRDEKYVSSLGNGYIMNFLLNKGLKRGFAVISDKRVYFRGSCFSGQGKSLKKTDEERTVDIRDITGSGFVYQRYIGILIALFTACVVLLGSVAGAGVGAVYSWQVTYRTQERERNAGEKLEEAKDTVEKLVELDEELSSLQEKESELSLLRQDIQKQSDEIMKKAENQEFLLDTEVSAAYEEYLQECVNLFETSQTYYCMQVLEEAAISNPEIADYIGLETPYSHSPNIDRNRLYESYNYGEVTVYNSIAMQNFTYLLDFYGYDYCIYKLALECYATCLVYDMPYDENTIYELIMEEVINGHTPYKDIMNEGWRAGRLSEGCWRIDTQYDEYSNWWAYGPDDCADEMKSLFLNFINKFVPEVTLNDMSSDKCSVTDNDKFTVLDLEASYLENISSGASVYDSELEQIRVDIERVEDEMSEISELNEELEHLERDYNRYKSESFGYYMLTTLASAGAAALVTFLISCIGIFFDYLSKRKTLFEIQYAGGRIAFDVSYYAKAEIDDFQKQLRRAKDFAQETATVRTVTVESPAQAPVQAPTQSSMQDDLRKYADLFKEGLISQEEYDAMKKKILGL